MTRYLLFVLAIALLAHTSNCARVVYDWDIGYVTVNRDGYNTRRAVGVNGKLPIPPMELTVGDTLVLNVHNSLNVTTSVHSHGLFHNGTSYLDGAATVTQCGIPPNESFTYSYVVEQAGTFWMHGHDHHQNSDGLRTPLIVHEKCEPPFEYDDEYLFALEDWYAEQFDERAQETMDPNKPFPPPHGYGFGIINGYNGNDTKPISFKPGRTYRLRVVNMASTQWFQFSIQGHKLRVIEADGVYCEPKEVDGLDMSPAQRYSVLVTAHNSTEYNYRYNATMYASFIPPAPGLSPRVFMGLVEYKQGAPVKNMTMDAESFEWVDDLNLNALDQQEALPVDRSMNFTIGNNPYTNGLHLDHINNITYAAPLVPSLYTALSMGDLATNESVYGPQTHAFVLKHLEVVEFIIHNPNALPHPLHLHGHAFQIMGYGPAPPSFPLNSTLASDRTQQGAPARRDTLVIPPYQYITIRFRADNPGVWLLHCHMDIHFVLGMVMTFVEAPLELQKSQQVPVEMFELCWKQGVKTSGNAAGNAGFDLTGLTPSPTIEAHGNQTVPT
ncbi:hypothetical protein GQ54DRAFT_338753 [Martensiomyces pterosporus]|nr:hypothetical protein GQ54DRAFT_338753 [Martensiomyces pterosporus]